MTSPWTVSELTRYIRQMFDTDYRLQDLTVEGELSNVSRPRSGHMYFTLKDDQATLRCVMWRGQVAQLGDQPRDGDHVLVHGHLSVYEAGGQYQLYADSLQLAGVGDLFEQFEALKRKLEAEGLFAAHRKRPLPAWPLRIALVTSPTGAALRDMLNVIERRWPLAELVLAPTAVQGESAPAEISAALQAAAQLAPDIILLARGGGSLEDLWAFNDEGVARTIAASPAPVVSGVGHETDFTIADFVADVRAPTPSAAAELATPDQREVRLSLDDHLATLVMALEEKLRALRWALAEREALVRGLSPQTQLDVARQHASHLSERATLVMRHRLGLLNAQIRGLSHTLASLSPLTTLARGYAIVTRAGTVQVIRAAADVQPGEALTVRVHDGEFGVSVSQNHIRG